MRGAARLPLNGRTVALGGPVQGILITLALLSRAAVDELDVRRRSDDHIASMTQPHHVSRRLNSTTRGKRRPASGAKAVKAVSLDQANANVREILANHEQLPPMLPARRGANTSAVSFLVVGGFRWRGSGIHESASGTPAHNSSSGSRRASTAPNLRSCMTML